MKIFILAILLIGPFAANAQRSVMRYTKGTKFNPAIGLNALTLFRNGSRNVENDGFGVQEIELQFTSDIDAYFRAEATISLHKEESEEGAEEEEHGHDMKIAPEELFIETLAVPHVTFRVGMFYVNFGKYNGYHTHALPFIYRGAVLEEMFGQEGLTEAGIGASFLAPLPWFSEVSLQAIQPKNETLFVESHHSMAYVAKWKNLWEISDAATLEWGVSGLNFSSHAHDANEKDEKVSLYGTDLTFKWRPAKDGRNSSFIWSTEFMRKERRGTNSDKNGGFLSFMRYQLTQQWYAQAKYEFLGIGKSANIKDVNTYTGMLAFIPSEFSSIRAQYDSIHDGLGKPEKRISLQLNISIGAHPAHIY